MNFNDLTPEQVDTLKDLLRRSGDTNKEIALAAQKLIAQEITAALNTPLNRGVLVGDTLGDIFEREVFTTGDIVYPTDLLGLDTEDFKAYHIPNQGRIPERMVEADELRPTTFRVGNSIDFTLKLARDARFDIVGRALEVLEAGFVQKLNDDAWHAIIQAGYSRGIIASDANAAPGQFTKGLVSVMKLAMRRGAGGNTGSLNRGRLTHLFVSPEALEDMRAWDASEIDEVTRREIYMADDQDSVEVYGVQIVPLDELGVDQPYQEYYTNVVADGAANGGLASATDTELVIGIDANSRDSFVMPVREPIAIFEDEGLHRQQRQGYYGWTEYGIAVLNNKRVLLGSM